MGMSFGTAQVKSGESSLMLSLFSIQPAIKSESTMRCESWLPTVTVSVKPAVVTPAQASVDRGVDWRLVDRGPIDGQAADRDYDPAEVRGVPGVGGGTGGCSEHHGTGESEGSEQFLGQYGSLLRFYPVADWRSCSARPIGTIQGSATKETALGAITL